MKETDSSSDVDTGLVVHHELNSTGDITQTNNCWIIDSGATCHICHKRALFVDFKQLKKTQEVVLGDGQSLKAINVGTVELELVIDNEKPKKHELYSVLYIPDLSFKPTKCLQDDRQRKEGEFLWF